MDFTPHAPDDGGGGSNVPTAAMATAAVGSDAECRRCIVWCSRRWDILPRPMVDVSPRKARRARWDLQRTPWVDETRLNKYEFVIAAPPPLCPLQEPYRKRIRGDCKETAALIMMRNLIMHIITCAHPWEIYTMFRAGPVPSSPA